MALDNRPFNHDYLYPSGAWRSDCTESFTIPVGKYFLGNVIALANGDADFDKREDEEKTIAEELGWSENEKLMDLFAPMNPFTDVVVVKHKDEDAYVFGFQSSSFETFSCEVMEDCAMKRKQDAMGAWGSQHFLISEALLPESFMRKNDPDQHYGIFVEFQGSGNDDKGVTIRIIHNDDTYGLVVCESYGTLLRISWGSNEDQRKKYPDPLLFPQESLDNALPATRHCTSDLLTLFVALNGQLSDHDETPLPEHLSEMLQGFLGPDKNNATAYAAVAAELAHRFLHLQSERESTVEEERPVKKAKRE